MSDPNDKSASILLKKQGKTEAIFLYDFAQFTGQNEDAGLYRAKINGCWHCPDGKYTALSADAVAALVRDWLTGAPPLGPRPQGLDKPVRVFAHWDDDDGCGCGQAWTKTPPHLGADARESRWGIVIMTTASRGTITNIVTVAQDGSEREMLCLPVRKLPAYLNSINSRKVAPELRAKIELYQAESDDALWNYWMHGRAERPAPQTAEAAITPDQQCTLQAIVRARVEGIPATRIVGRCIFVNGAA